jgi:hypothetical protein
MRTCERQTLLNAAAKVQVFSTLGRFSEGEMYLRQYTHKSCYCYNIGSRIDFGIHYFDRGFSFNKPSCRLGNPIAFNNKYPRADWFYPRRMYLPGSKSDLPTEPITYRWLEPTFFYFVNLYIKNQIDCQPQKVRIYTHGALLYVKFSSQFRLHIGHIYVHTIIIHDPCSLTLKKEFLVTNASEPT